MGNRILKESICLNRKIDQLSDFQENLFYRMIVKVDDYGIFLADPVVLASILYPRKRNLNLRLFAEALSRMEALGLIRLYACDGENYFQIVSWDRHQRMRSSVHKYPTPEEGEAPAAGKEETAGSAEGQTEGNDPGEKNQPGNPADESGEPEVRELPVIELPLNDNSSYGVTGAEIEEYAALYPAVDILQELRNIRGWCVANPQRRKTRSGVRWFINGWLSRKQDKGGSPGPQLPDNPFIRMASDPSVWDSPGSRSSEPDGSDRRRDG